MKIQPTARTSADRTFPRRLVVSARAFGAMSSDDLIPLPSRQLAAKLFAELEAQVDRSKAPADAWVDGMPWPREDLARWRADYFSHETDAQGRRRVRVHEDALEKFLRARWPNPDSNEGMLGVPYVEREKLPTEWKQLWQAVFSFLPEGGQTAYLQAKQLEGDMLTAVDTEGRPFAGVGTLAAYYGRTARVIRTLLIGCSRFPGTRYQFNRRTETGVVKLTADDPDVARVLKGMAGTVASHRDVDRRLASRALFWLTPAEWEAQPAAPAPAPLAAAPKWWQFWRRARRTGNRAASGPPLQEAIGKADHVPRARAFGPLITTFAAECREQEGTIREEMRRFSDAVGAAEERARQQHDQVTALHTAVREPGSDAAAWDAMHAAVAEMRERVRIFLASRRNDS